MVYTVRFAGIGRRGGQTMLENELRRLGITQKNSRPNHPTTCGKVERFQQTLKKWLHAQAHQPQTISELQALIDDFVVEYNHRRPHRSLAAPDHPSRGLQRHAQSPPGTPRPRHPRPVRHDRVNKAGSVTLRVAGPAAPHRDRTTYEGTCVILLVQDLNIRVVNAITGELLRELTVDPSTTTSPPETPGPAPHKQVARTYVSRSGAFRCLETSHW